MLRQLLRKQKRILRGAVNTYLRRSGRDYDAHSWWDRNFYTVGISDRQTISPGQSQLSAMYHYASVEMLILRHLFNNRVVTDGASVLDLGSGSGHWIDFFANLGCSPLVGVDVAESAANHLRRRYADHDEVTIHHGGALPLLRAQSDRYDIVNAIGVMFHIVDDAQWQQTIDAVGSALHRGGLFVVSGHFGWLDNINVQIDGGGQINKRLRSLRRWRKALKGAGFSALRLYRNRSFMGIEDRLPENSVVIATR